MAILARLGVTCQVFNACSMGINRAMEGGNNLMKRDAALSFIRHRATLVRTFNGQFYALINGSWYRNVYSQERIALSELYPRIRSIYAVEGHMIAKRKNPTQPIQRYEKYF